MSELPASSGESSLWAMPVLPHQGPMRWIERARVSAEGTTGLAVVQIAADHPFVRDGVLLASALIEMLAQAAAAGSAMKAGQSGKQVGQGVLAGIREFIVHGPVPAGATLEL